MQANPKFVTAPIVFVCDCDANKTDAAVGLLFVRAIPQNPNNTKITVGIENALAPALIEDRFYNAREEKSALGEKKIIQSFNKAGPCDYICSEREFTTEQAAQDLAGFAQITAILDAIPTGSEVA